MMTLVSRRLPGLFAADDDEVDGSTGLPWTPVVAGESGEVLVEVLNSSSSSWCSNSALSTMTSSRMSCLRDLDLIQRPGTFT